MNAVVETRAVSGPVTPAEMLMKAVERGTDMAQIQQLMDLQERWEKNQARKAFDAAMADAKSKIKPISKGREVDYTFQGKRTHYHYEDLALIAEEVDPILAEFGLSYRFRSTQDGKELVVTCIVAHRDGHYEETTLRAENDSSGGKNTIQGIGSAATYLQRYTLKMALGLSAAKDDDGKAAAEAASEQQKDPPPDGYDDWKADISAVVDEGMERLQFVWKASNQDMRRYVIKNDSDWWDRCKASAAKVQK